MGYLADNFEPQVLQNKQKDQQIQFSICLYRFQWEKSNLSLWNWI